jgi:hypothetical protein
MEPPVPIGEEAVWAPRTVWTRLRKEKIPAPGGNPDRPPRSSVTTLTELPRLPRYGCKGKVVPVLNWAPRHEDVLVDGSIAPCILDLDTRSGWVVRFTPRPLYPRGNSILYPLDRKLGGLQSQSGRGGKENKFSAPTGNRTPEPRSSCATTKFGVKEMSQIITFTLVFSLICCVTRF